MADTPDLKSLGIQALTALFDTVKTARDFTMEQAPDVIRQMVQYYAITSWLGVIAGIIGLGLSVACAFWLARLVPKWLKLGSECHHKFSTIKEWTDLGERYSIFATLSIASVMGAFIGSGAIIFNSLPIAISTTWAPKWFIITKLAELIK